MHRITWFTSIGRPQRLYQTMTKINCVKPLSKVSRILSKEGLLPNSTVTKKMYTVNLILHTLFPGTTIGFLVMNGINAIQAGNGKALYRTFCILIPAVNLVVKMVIVVVKKETFLSLLNYIKSDIFNSHSEELNSYVRFVYRISELIWKYYAIVIAGYVFVEAILPLTVDIKTMVIPPPFDMGKFEVIYKCLHIGQCLYFGLNSLCLDVLYMSLLGLGIAQLYILEERLIYVFEEVEKTCEHRASRERTWSEERILLFCVVLYETLNQYVDKLSVILSFPLFVQYFCGCFIICNFVLQFTVMGERDSGNVIIMIAYAGITFSQIAVYHWLGNEIMFKSENIVDACYLSQWYKLNKRSKKILIILMERAKRPLAVQLYKLIFISLESLGVVMRWTYSLFALIKARYN